MVAAHAQVANKLSLGDEFSLMNKAFVEAARPVQVDLCVAEGMVVDLGAASLEVVHSPRQCWGSVCLHVPQRRMRLSGDTVMAQGVFVGVLISGNKSGCIRSLHRLQRLRIDTLLPGQGRVSQDVESEFQAGLARLHGMIDDSHTLFAALRKTDQGFDDVMRSLRDLNAL